jgi:hypothetical protein
LEEIGLSVFAGEVLSKQFKEILDDLDADEMVVVLNIDGEVIDFALWVF